MGLVDGITTNPTIMLRDGYSDLKAAAVELASLIAPRPISVEVTTDDLDGMVRQGRDIARWAPNIVIKIPQLTQDAVPCYGVISQLENDGIKVNATLAMSFGHVMLSAKAGATYISIFVGRVGDEGGDAAVILRDSVAWLKAWGYKSKIISASIRSVPDFNLSANAGSHIITTPPQFLQTITDHKCAREGVRKFMIDAKAAITKMEQARNKPG